jgi:NAD+ synthase
MYINIPAEEKRITAFLQTVFARTQLKRGIIAWSGGIDSTVSLYLLARSIPVEHITILHLPYETSCAKDFELIAPHLKLMPDQFHVISIKAMVDAMWQTLKDTTAPAIRKGNIMARSRMIVLYDWAKKTNALVCGTENKTEDLLGYFTRFGDAASDIEPIRHLYKAQVFQLAQHLGVPETFITRAPTAGLWSGQTDEGEFGFSYAEADEVLLQIFEYSKPVEEVEKEFPHARKIVALANQNSFKHDVPYSL